MPLKTGDCETPKLSEMRIVLMGYKGAGKSSAGNIILNREEFDLKRTAQCVKRQREVADRHITVIEAPGWWIDESVDQSSELLKQEILLSVSLCPPGPHVVLLVIRVDIRFKEDERKVFQGFVDLLSERVWSHTIVLFTQGDFLGDTSIEQHIEREGEDLQWLVEKCGNRYHVLNNMNRSDDTQIKDLLKKIEETVMKNKCCHFEMDRNILQMMEEKKQAEEESAMERRKRMSQRREMSRSQMNDFHHLSELRIVLMGSRRAGKSSAGNIILNREEFDLKTTDQCMKRQREVADRHITVIEAPGWWWTPVEQISEILQQEILLSVSLCPPGPHIVLLVICVEHRFTVNDREAFQAYVELLGERVWSHTIVLFTHGDFLGDTSIEQHIEREGEDLQWLVEKCGNRYHVLNNKIISDDTQIKDLLEKIEETVTQNNGCHFEIDKKILEEAEERTAEGQRAKERRKKLHKSRSQIMSEDEMSDTVSLASSDYGSFRSRSGSDKASFSASSCSRDTPYNFNGTELQQPLSEDDISDTVSLGSSDYGSFRSNSGIDNSSVYSSCSKDLPYNFRDGSVHSTSESVEKSGPKGSKNPSMILKLLKRGKQNPPEEIEHNTFL
ncbi:GTPase IMAP family member 8-like isoform X1 [Triplophysa dalaica]|uniref:GTPase IMAP family member 8-like isoform X1 n=1 Tax=Triplophysa dalaica TaxID=1582913 RepID=UPI0024DF79C8|nr:GTPase IMAP family member 8-like isoform X1 [Triplophysa dalaica]